MKSTIRLVLGDQLNPLHSWYKSTSKDITYVFIECREEASYAPHHIQKVVGIFAAMRDFAQRLRNQGHQVWYHHIFDSQTTELSQILYSACKKIGSYSVVCQEPDEYRVAQYLQNLQSNALDIRFESSEHFISSPSEFQEMFKGKKSFLMETFYRKLRKRTGLLMDGKEPHGGQWNLDHQNRKKLPKNHLLPPAYLPSTDVTKVYQDVQQAGLKTIGTLQDPKQFYWPTNTDQAWEVFDHWLNHKFGLFGDFQDAMTVKDWALYHSRISFALNTKMIDPLEVCRRAEDKYRADPSIALNAAEGFIRQILGWREYMRNVYWTSMPDFASANYFNHKNDLPDWFWTGKTKMKCQEHAITQSLQYGYAHHIQRLMVTGNFALLAGIDPDQVDQWYLGIYVDAFEWVEITNTRGMSQYADGGKIATKPYVASANYMNKMGDYCINCSYDRKTKTETNSCPLNTLYWDFFDRNRSKLDTNFRLGMVYRTYDKMGPELKDQIRKRALYLHEHLNEL